MQCMAAKQSLPWGCNENHAIIGFVVLSRFSAAMRYAEPPG